MNRSEARQAIARFPKSDATAAFAAGVGLLRADYPELLLPVARKLARSFPDDARMHQLLGLAARACGESATALRAFAQAAKLAPQDLLIAHSHARTSLEAGVPATTLFERAVQLAPMDGAARQGLAAALFHERRPADAIDLLTQWVKANPLWLDGHRDLARLRGQMALAPLDTLADAVANHPASDVLHRLQISLALEACDLGMADEAVRSAQMALGDPAWLATFRAHVASERGEMAAADEIFQSMPKGLGVEDASLYARHLIRCERADAAVALLEPLIDRDREQLLWPYLSLGWRMAGDDRWQWLAGDPRLIGIYDLSGEIGDLAALQEHLRDLHISKAAPLDQSVRGGTQTDGNLLLRLDPPLRRLKKAFLSAVEKHVSQLPAAVSGHPTLLKQRMPQRIAGSWSVRLRDAGFHTDHVHSQGWLSSAFYVALPESRESPPEHQPHQGWLSLGECRELVPALAPVRLVEPKEGHLILFPSSMWHGTRPFPSGERMTVAFDIAKPKQSDKE